MALVNAQLPFIIFVGRYETTGGAHTLARGHIGFPGIPPFFPAPPPSAPPVSFAPSSVPSGSSLPVCEAATAAVVAELALAAAGLALLPIPSLGTVPAPVPHIPAGESVMPREEVADRLEVVWKERRRQQWGGMGVQTSMLILDDISSGGNGGHYRHRCNFGRELGLQKRGRRKVPSDNRKDQRQSSCSLEHSARKKTIQLSLVLHQNMVTETLESWCQTHGSRNVPSRAGCKSQPKNQATRSPKRARSTKQLARRKKGTRTKLGGFKTAAVFRVNVGVAPLSIRTPAPPLQPAWPSTRRCPKRCGRRRHALRWSRSAPTPPVTSGIEWGGRRDRR